MSLIAIAIFDTDDNDRSKYTKECLASLVITVDLSKHRVVLVDNNSCFETKKILHEYNVWNNITVITLSENIGTAAAINLALKMREPNEVCIKMDNDCVVHQDAWVEEMEEAIKVDKTLGIVGLKRPDVWQSPTNPDPRYRTILETLKNGIEIEVCEDIMGTCTGYNPLLMDKIGPLVQNSEYGFDDTIYSVRSVCAGFKNCFLPNIKITHLDDYKNPYSDWKKKHAFLYLEEVAQMCEMYKSGKLSYKYDWDI